MSVHINSPQSKINKAAVLIKKANQMNLDLNSTDIVHMVIVLPSVDIDQGDIYSAFIQANLDGKEPTFKVLTYNGRTSSMMVTDEITYNQQIDDKEEEDQYIVLNLASKSLIELKLISMNSKTFLFKCSLKDVLLCNLTQVSMKQKHFGTSLIPPYILQSKIKKIIPYS